MPSPLLAFDAVPEDGLPSADAPVTMSLVALRHGERLLLIRDSGRGTWELPGGGIEPGETPRAAAVRELDEESGQTADGLSFVGYALIRFPRQAPTYAAFFTGTTPEPRPFTPNDEVSDVLWWSPGDPLPEPHQPLHLDLVQLARG